MNTNTVLMQWAHVHPSIHGSVSAQTGQSSTITCSAHMSLTPVAPVMPKCRKLEHSCCLLQSPSETEPLLWQVQKITWQPSWKEEKHNKIKVLIHMANIGMTFFA